MTKAEYRFQTRLIRILRDKGFLVINAASKQLFDIVAIKGQVAYPIELKAKITEYSSEQHQRQVKIAQASDTAFFEIRQSKNRGKMTLLCDTKFKGSRIYMLDLIDDLEEYLE